MLEYAYKLTGEIDYQSEGQNLKADTIVLYPPSYSSREFTFNLKQLFFRAVKSFKNDSSESKQEEGKDEISPDDIIAMFYASDVDINDVFNSFEKVILNGHAKINGEVKLTKFHLDQLMSDDIENMMGAYLSHFLLASWMSRLTTKS